MTVTNYLPNALHVSSDELPFVELGDGTSIQLLHSDIEQGIWVVRTLFEPGTTLQRHRHTGLVHAFTHAGTWKYLEYPEINTAGSYLFEPAGSIHTLIVPKENDGLTDATFVIQGANLYLDENDKVETVVDAGTVRFIYDALVEAKGLPKPPVVTGGTASVPRL